MRIIRRVSMGHQFAYLAGVTLLVVLAGAVGAWFFDRGEPNATIHSIGDALWWSSAMVTTITNEKFVVSPEARILAILMRVYAVTAFGLITATFATYLIGQRVNPAERQDVDTHSLNQQIERLHEDIIRLRQELATIREG
jgi:voltage-gated potassium channel